VRVGKTVNALAKIAATSFEMFIADVGYFQVLLDSILIDKAPSELSKVYNKETKLRHERNEGAKIIRINYNCGRRNVLSPQTG